MTPIMAKWFLDGRVVAFADHHRKAFLTMRGFRWTPRRGVKWRAILAQVPNRMARSSRYAHALLLEAEIGLPVSKRKPKGGKIFCKAYMYGLLMVATDPKRMASITLRNFPKNRRRWKRMEKLLESVPDGCDCRSKFADKVLTETNQREGDTAWNPVSTKSF